MTKRKDPQPEAVESLEVRPEEAPVPVEPFVVTDPGGPPEPKPDLSEPPLPPAPTVMVRRGGLVAPLFGGALAAAAGFALSHFDAFGLRPADNSAELAALAEEVEARTARIETAGAEIAALSERIGQLESAPPPAPPDLSRLDTLEQRLAAIEAMPTDGAASLAAVTAKLAELERRLSEMPQGAAPELRQEIDAALARLSEAEAAATARATEAEAAAVAARRTQALDALAGRLAAGDPFSAELQALGDPALNQALSPLADAGAPTLGELQLAFPDAAREALRIARAANEDDGWVDRFVDFLAAQSGARPVTPQEGETPEAILSRAEFALSEARLADAVAELGALDPVARAPLDSWLAQAGAHLAATAALQTARGE